MLRRHLSHLINRLGHVLRDVLFALAAAIGWVSLVFVLAVLFALLIGAVVQGPERQRQALEALWK